MANLKKKIYLILLFFISALAIFFRVVNLEKSPPFLNWDEASLGYNAYCLLKTGRDEYNRFLPLSLRSFNDYKPAFYAYATMPFVHFLGLSQTAVRLPSALAGGLLVPVIFGLAYLLTGYWPVALLSAGLIAFEPWSLHFSRIAFEANLACFLAYLGLFLFLLAKRKAKNLFFFAGIICLALSAYTYHSNRFIYFPFIFLTFLWWVFKKEVRPKTSFPVLLALLGLLPLIKEMVKGGVTRLSQTNFWTKFWPFVPTGLLSTQNPYFSFPHHPVWYALQHFFGRIFSYFSPINLFFYEHLESAQHTPTMAVFQSWEALFWLVGLALLIIAIAKGLGFKTGFSFSIVEPVPVLFWIFLAISPAAVTWNWFYVVRSLNLYPIYSIITAIGIFFIGQKIWRCQHFGGIFYGLAMIALIIFGDAYLINTEIAYSPKVTQGAYQPGGYKEGAPFLKRIQDNYDEIIIDTPHSQPHIFFLFYQAYPPSLIQNDAHHQLYGTQENIFDFGKFHFRPIYWPDDKMKKNTLFWGTVYSLPKEDVLQAPNARFLAEFEDALGNSAAVLVELK